MLANASQLSAQANSSRSLAIHVAPLGGQLWNLHDTDILSVIKAVAAETGKNFVIDPRVRGKISLIATKPIATKDIYAVLLTLLATLGYAAIPTATGVIKIVPNFLSNETTTSLATSNDPGKSGTVVVRVIALKTIAAAQLLTILRPLLPQWTNMAVYQPGNILILSGYAQKIQHIFALINAIEHHTQNELTVYHLKHANAGQLALTIRELQAEERISGDMPVAALAVDPRLNNIILYGSKVARDKMQYLLRVLDVASLTKQIHTAVVAVRYLSATELAPVLNKLAADFNMARLNAAGGGNSSHETTTTSQQLPWHVQAERTTNSLLLTASEAMLKTCKTLIRRLDQRPAQVLIAAVIAEVDVAHWQNLGIQWGASAINTTLAGDGELSTSFPFLGAGNFGLMPNVQIRTVLSMLTHLRGTNILATPNIVVLDRQQAHIAVGQDVPQQTGTFSTPATNSGAVAPFNTFNRRQVALQLTVTPRVTVGQAVALAITLKNDSLQNPDNPGPNPLINISQLKNNVIVGSKQVLVLGGLISHNYHESLNKVPLLGDLPVLKVIFSQKVRILEKKLLMVFIEPIILNN